MEPEVQRKVRRPAKRNIILLSLLVFILLMLAVSAQFIYTLAKYDKVYAGVSINGINASGYTKSELEKYLDSHYDNKVGSLSIVLKAGNKEAKTTYNELGVQYDIKAAVKEAFAVGRTGSLPSRLIEIYSANKSGKTVSMPLVYDKASIEGFIGKFYDMTYIELKKADIQISGDKVVVRSGRHGESIDKSKVLGQLSSSLESLENITLTADVVNTPAEKVTAEELKKQINQEPANAGFKVESKEVTLVPHVVGRKIDENQLAAAVKTLDSNEDTEVTIPVVSVLPEITTEVARSRMLKDTLATMRSHFSTGDENDQNRAVNMKLAVAKIDGTILAPGEVFSFNNIVGPRTEEGGYQEAHTYVAGKVVNGIGGGICQISSTLYNAVLKSDLGIVERRNHMFTVGYVPKGQDATVSYGTTDFRFKNNTGWPIKIIGNVTDDNYVYFALKGTNTTPGKQVVITSEVIKTIPFTTKYIDDPTRAQGQTYIRQAGKDGYVVETYKVIKQDGAEISRTKISTSKYSPLTKEVLRGTKKVTSTTPKPSAAPTPTPQPTQQGVDDAENPPAPSA